MHPPSSFLAAAESLGLAFDADDLPRLGGFLARLLEANERFNLTTIREPEAAWERHVLDSLTLLPFLAEIGAASVIDVGSGGGLPALPLAICLPEVRFVLAEATGKKARYLEETARELGLRNATVVCERAETLGRDPAHRNAYDAVTARAVGPLPVLLELTLPLARVGGMVLAIKGERAGEEIEAAAAALRTLRSQVVATERTPTGTIVAIEKQGPTPKAYPRRPGEPKRMPL